MLAACGDSDVDSTANADVVTRITRSGSATRDASPFSFVQTLRTGTADGRFLEQRTEGIYDGERASIVVTTDGDASDVFTVSSTIDPGSVLRFVIDGSAIYLRVDFLGIDDASPWSVVEAGPTSPNAEGTVSILGVALVANAQQADVVGVAGDEVIAGESVTHYRVPAPASDVAIYLPTETLDLLVERGFVREQVSVMTSVDYWLSDDGRVMRVSIDHMPLLEALGVGRFSNGPEVTELRHTFEIVQFGGVDVVVPDPSEVATDEGE